MYASALGITEREARELAGLPVSSVVERWSLRRWAIVLGFLTVLAAFLVFVLRPQLFPAGPPAPPPLREAGSGRGTTPGALGDPGRRLQRHPAGECRLGLANEIAGMAYGIGEVRNADRRNYAETRVYYPPGAEAIAQRLARARRGDDGLPGGDDPSRLVVIAGQSRWPTLVERRPERGRLALSSGDISSEQQTCRT